MTTIFNAEGLRAVYRGLATSMVGVMPFNAIKLTSYDTARALVMEARQHVHAGASRTREGGGPRDETAPTAVSLPPAVTAAIGAVSGVTAATVCFPIEVIRRRQMVGELSGMGVHQAIASLYRSDGISALYRGVFINAAKVSLGTGATFCLYELFKDCLSVDGRQPPWEKLADPKWSRDRHEAPRS
uniref:ADP,ATP carrier protein n=1 Tax=Haptolina brevifila TaxID=156173 RepID=A0A7S2DVI2_9EUKA